MSLPAPPTSTNPSPNPLKHLPALDGLRGLAIALVLAHNFATVALPAGALGRVVEMGLDMGWIGVQLFFVLSGFLITRILLQTQASPNYYKAFFGRRVLRIFPLYYGALLVAFVLLPALGAGTAALKHDAAHQGWLWLYLSNWTQPLEIASKAFPHFWSLAIEEQFYLLWPLLVHRRSAAQVLRWCLAIAVLSLAIRAGMLWQGMSVEAVYTYTVCRMDALALGAAVAAWLQMPGVADRLRGQGQRLVWGALALWAIGLIATRGYPRTSVLGQTLGYSWLALVFAMVVLAVACADERANHEPFSWGAWWGSSWKKALNWPPLRTLGLYSYAMYVFHKPLHDLVGKPLLVHFGLLKQPSYGVALAYVALATVVTLAAAVLSYHLFERHFLALKRWFVATPRAAAPAQPG